MPISLTTGSIVTVLMSFDLKDTMPEGTMLEVDVKKDGWLIDIPIPCTDSGDGTMIGSCDYAMADIMAGLDNGEAGCPTDKMPEGQGCSLPLAPGLYGGPPALEVTQNGQEFHILFLSYGQ